MSASLKNRVVVVTGGSKGIGRGIAQVFVDAGAKVAIMARDGAVAQRVAAEMGQGAIGIAIGISGDVTSKTSLDAAYASVVKQLGNIDVLCANAGIFPMAVLETMTEAEWDETSDTNLKGTFLSVQAALPYLKKSDQGRIILTSSITGPVTGFSGWTHYGASKAGQLGFMRTACLELAPYGITVNAVLPGNIITESFLSFGAQHQAAMVAAVPLRRLGTVADIGHAVAYFASKEAAYVTGQTIIVDGGQILPESADAMVKF
jgi:3-oxoacyl-[acyl-carrier protein] reductase